MEKQLKEANYWRNLNGVLAAVFLITTMIAIWQRDSWQESYNSLKQGAINQGYAHYNPTNGVWQWTPRPDRE